MRIEIRCAVATAAALIIGTACATPYARLTAPYDAAIARLMAASYPWQILDADVTHGEKAPGAVLRLIAAVRRDAEDPKPAAIVIGRMDVGAAIETPLLFWTILLLWPIETRRARLRLLALGIPIFVALHAATTVAQLMSALPATSAILAGDANPRTFAEYWSQFLEAGGRFALELCAALLTVALAQVRSAQRALTAAAV
jgi:hypothetical protein